MNATNLTPKIAHYLAVRQYPTGVRLADLDSEDAAWISQHYYQSPEIKQYLKAIYQSLSAPSGAAWFLIGHYGSGKSHFLSFLAQKIAQAKVPNVPHSPKESLKVVTLSLLNYSADNRLESIIEKALGIPQGDQDRRIAWNKLQQKQRPPILLLIDELSEFLRSKADQRSFNEDIRFLQYMGEWTQDHPFWLLCAMQEQIEHTGDIEYSLYKKIKDRFPTRFLLSPTHIKKLIEQHLLIKKPEYAAAVAQLLNDLKQAFPQSTVDFQSLQGIYPLHPATLSLLEEVRDRFSQTRGMIDFTVNQLQGNEARGIDAFLQRPCHNYLTMSACPKPGKLRP